MSVSPSSRTIICQEIFDENSIPSEEEIIQFAKNIGINPDTEPHLLPYAKDGLMQPLPKDWTVCLDQKYQQPFYYNSYTKQSSWEHPLDARYRNLISKIRAESGSSAGDEDSKTSAREDLKSFEEAAMQFPKSSDFSEKLTPIKKTLSPLSKPPTKIAFGSNTGAVKKDIFEKNDAKSKLNLDLIAKKDFISESIDVDKISSPLKPEANKKLAQEKHPRGMNRKGELTLSGDGAKFLKSNQKTDSSPLSASTPGFESAPIIEFSHSSKDEQLKSILREKTLWDTDPTQLSNEEKLKWRKQELEEEKKSVRFDLDKQLSNIKFNLTDSEEIEEDVEEEADDDDEWSDDDDEEVEDEDEEVIYNKEKIEKQRKLTKTKSDLYQNPFTKKLDQESQMQKIGLLGSKLMDLHKEPIVKFKPVPRQNSESQIGRFRVTETKTYDPDFVYKKFSSVDSALPKNRFTINLIEVDDIFKKDKDAKNKIAFNTSDKSPSSQESSQSLKQNEENMLFKDLNIKESTERDIEERRVEELEEKEEKVILKKSQEIFLPYEKNEDRNETNLRRKTEHNVNEMYMKLEFDKQLEIKILDEEKNKYKLELEKKFNEKKLYLEKENNLKIQELISQKENELEIILENEKKKFDTESDEKVKTYINQRNQELDLLLEEEKKKFDSIILNKLQELNNINQNELDNKLKEHREKLDIENNQKIKEFVENKRKEFDQIIENEKMKLEKESQENMDIIKKDIFSKLKTENSVECASQCDQISFSEINNLKQENTQLKIQIKELEASDHIKELKDANEKMKIELEREIEEKRLDLDREQVLMLENMKAEQVIRLEKLRQGFKREEEAARQDHAERMVELRARMELERQRTRDRSLSEEPTRQELIETSRVFEKMRCEKRLLEDKYRTLKEKYVRLKGDVKSSMERRRRREAGTTTETETERSSPHKASHSLERHVEQAAVSEEKRVPKSKPSELLGKSCDKDCGSELSSTPAGMDNDNLSSTSSQRTPLPAEGVASRRRRHLFARLKSASTSRLVYNNNNNNNLSDTDVKFSSSPVENLRKQLQKLDDLEDQFPAATHTDTYMRYPFKDTGRVTSATVVKDQLERKALLDEIGAGDFGSCEFEFFRHRIHLERDSVRRAKAFLRAQRGTFRSRQRELRQRQTGSAPAARNMLESLYQEEREISDMEVSLHRTRSLLGEKIIRLRHLEHSLKHASPKHQMGLLSRVGEDATLSDLSSHSGSSGFSSTELHTPADGRMSIPRQSKFQESNEIIQSLENLNSEIREIWEVLSKQQKEGQKQTVPPPPPPLIYPEVGWAHPGRRQDSDNVTGLPADVDPTLIERTKSLRDWLRQARNETIDLISPSQATL